MAKNNLKLQKLYKEAYVDMLEEIKPWLENYDKLTFSQKREFERRLTVTKSMKEISDKLADDVDFNVKDYLRDVGDKTYIDLEDALKFDNTAIDVDYLEALIDKPIAGQRLSERLHKDCNKLAERSTNAIRRGLIKGDSYDKIAGRLRDLNVSSYNNAMRIVRTESSRISSEVTQKGYQDAKKLGIKLKKKWVSGHDNRTRSNHAKLDGQIVDIDEEFEVNGHKALGPSMFGVPSEDINCRCTTVEVLVDEEDVKVVEQAEKPTKDDDKLFSEKAEQKMSDAYSDEQLKAFREEYNPMNKDVTRAIDKLLSGDIKLLHHTTGGRSHFAPQKGGEILVTNTKSRTFYHEIGHGIDNLAYRDVSTGIYDMRVSISDMVKKDLDNTIYKGTLAEMRTLNRRTKVGKARYNEIWDEQRKYRSDFEKFLGGSKFQPEDLDSISDILGGAKFNFVTRSKSLGHSESYWANETALGDEAIAHIFSSMATQANDMEILKKCLPDTFKFVENMIKKL